MSKQYQPKLSLDGGPGLTFSGKEPLAPIKIISVVVGISKPLKYRSHLFQLA
jgi:hypothetical protein